MPWLARAAGRSVSANLVLLGNVAHRIVQRLVGHLDAGAIGALHLQLLQNQAVEHLLAQDVLRRQLVVLRAQAFGDDQHLFVELARQHDALVYGGRDPVEEHAGTAGFTGLGERRRGSETGQHNQEAARKFF